MNFNIHISYQDQDVLVRPLFEKSDHLFIDAHGAIYQKTWKRDKRASKNAKERKQLKFDFNDITYSKYSDGILSLRRALMAAITTSEVTIITHKEWLQLVEEFHSDILAYDLSKFSGYEPFLARVARKTSHLKTDPMKEAHEQLVSIIRLQDAQGRYNTSALCARSVAVQERIIERLKSVRAWQFHFTTQSVLIENEWRRFCGFIQTLELFVAPRTAQRLYKMSGNEEMGTLNEISNWFHKANYYASFTFYSREMTQLASSLDVLVGACNTRDKTQVTRALKAT
ncbi:hypothetical protein IT409_02845, partial [Candidatus Falkowbacteria bacterium]|nr:hypothetical protein [Candidatus Falkowbacteria bacterium]